MASEILIVPEQHLAEVIRVIRSGLAQTSKNWFIPALHPDVVEQLTTWCNEEEAYLNQEVDDGDE